MKAERVRLFNCVWVLVSGVESHGHTEVEAFGVRTHNMTRFKNLCRRGKRRHEL